MSGKVKLAGGGKPGKTLRIDEIGNGNRRHANDQPELGSVLQIEVPLGSVEGGRFLLVETAKSTSIVGLR